MQCCLSPQQRGKVVVIQAAVTHINPTKGSPDKVRIYGGSQLQGSIPVGYAIYAEGNTNAAAQTAHHISHGCRCHKIHMTLVGQAEFIGNQDAVYATILQSRQIGFCVSHHRCHGIPIAESGISRQGIQMQHGNDGLFDMKQLLGPKHTHSPLQKKLPGTAGS